MGRRLANDRGASAVEYALILTAVAAVIVIAITGLGKLVNDTYQGTCDRIASQTSSSTC